MAKTSRARKTVTKAETPTNETQEVIVDETQVQEAKEEATAKTTKSKDSEETKATSKTEEATTVAEEEATVEAVEEEPVKEEVKEEPVKEAVEEEPALDPLKDGNYLNLPKALRDAEASQEQIHTPTGTRRTPPMNPFMKIQQEREAKMVKSNVPTSVEMGEKIKSELRVNVEDHFVLGSIVAKLNNYVSCMAPNTPVGDELGARWQAELSKCFFEALSAAPEASIVALQILELYFTEYRTHAFARTHVFRFMDLVRLDQQRLTAFQSLLHLFVELGSKDGRTKNEIQRQVNISKIADSIADNTDAQTRLVEFLN